jgi:WD40 repeat protein/sterol desaturase/sphingolipid hydroxylase (fatty acid hydroxylase superfamily)
MDGMAWIGQFWLTTLGRLAACAVLFGLLVRLMPCNPGMYWWKSARSAVTDAVYWLIVPIFLRILSLLMLAAGIVLLCGGHEPHWLPVRSWPLWQQCAAIVLLQDVLLYWIHRLFHVRGAWKFHAVHHSPTVLDWTATARFHPVNNLLAFNLADVVVLLLGFAPEAVALLAPVNTLYSAMVHANLNWTFGPLRYIFASPVFHRWHHATRDEGLDKNFAATFPILDVLFGTFYMPRGRLPQEFGTGAADFPAGFWGQFLHPFRSDGAAAAARRRAIFVRAASILALTGLVGGGTYCSILLATRNEQQTVAQQRARHTVDFRQAATAWAENDLVRAAAILDAATADCPGGEEESELRALCRRKCLVLTGHTGAVVGVAVSVDGRHIVSASEDGTLKIWDALTGAVERTLTGHTGPVRGVALSADGRRILSASHDRTLKIWDVDTGSDLRTLPGHSGAILAVALSSDSGRAVSGSADGTVRLWDLEAGHEKRSFPGGTGEVITVAIGADGQRVAWAAGRIIKIASAAGNGQERALIGHADLVCTVALSPDGERVVSGSFDRSVKVWNATTGLAVQTLTGHDGPVSSVAISSDGRTIVSGSQDGTVRVWDLATGREQVVLRGHSDSVMSVALSADGRKIVSAGRDGTVKVWDTALCRQTTSHAAGD